MCSAFGDKGTTTGPTKLWKLSKRSSPLWPRKPGRKGIPTEYLTWRQRNAFPCKGTKIWESNYYSTGNLPRAPTEINCMLYPLNWKETDVLRKFLEEEEERKGYITPGSSPYTAPKTAPVFFMSERKNYARSWTIGKLTTRPSEKPQHPDSARNTKGSCTPSLILDGDIKTWESERRISTRPLSKQCSERTYPKWYISVWPTRCLMFQRIIHQDLRPTIQKYLKNFGNYWDDTWIYHIEKSWRKGATSKNHSRIVWPDRKEESPNSNKKEGRRRRNLNWSK